MQNVKCCEQDENARDAAHRQMGHRQPLRGDDASFSEPRPDCGGAICGVQTWKSSTNKRIQRRTTCAYMVCAVGGPKAQNAGFLTSRVLVHSGLGQLRVSDWAPGPAPLQSACMLLA